MQVLIGTYFKSDKRKLYVLLLMTLAMDSFDRNYLLNCN